MSSPQDRSAAFAQERGKLWSVAYRMLGSRADAEDAVQEAYLRWHGARVEEIRAPQAWLVTTTTRLCIDRLRQLRAEREHYTGPWLPEPLVGEAPPPADAAAELASDLSVALLAVLERLAPEERAAFLLREAFDVDYEQIAQALGKSEAACRQIVSRAAKRVRAEKPRLHVSLDAKTRLLDQLARALQTHDQNALLEILAEDSSWISDGGGKQKAALKEVRGAAHVARFAVGVFRRIAPHTVFRAVNVNGEPGFAVFYEESLLTVLCINTDGRRIVDVYSILNPDKLRGVHIAAR
ncbi:MAG TPA: RNA polymerase sigma-70 factor [Gammaproteobacteria bacterium]|nr:RNA polymerase sigma-70 factor [Gammaproteobacteria bacterium]